MASSSASKALVRLVRLPKGRRAGTRFTRQSGSQRKLEGRRKNLTSPLPIGSTAMFETHVEADEMMSWPMMLKLCKSATH